MKDGDDRVFELLKLHLGDAEDVDLEALKQDDFFAGRELLRVVLHWILAAESNAPRCHPNLVLYCQLNDDRLHVGLAIPSFAFLNTLFGCCKGTLQRLTIEYRHSLRTRQRAETERHAACTLLGYLKRSRRWVYGYRFDGLDLLAAKSQSLEHSYWPFIIVEIIFAESLSVDLRVDRDSPQAEEERANKRQN